jgi:hypothetical protein
MVVHQGKYGLFKIIGEYCMEYLVEPNMSL